MSGRECGCVVLWGEWACLRRGPCLRMRRGGSALLGIGGGFLGWTFWGLESDGSKLGCFGDLILGV